VAPSADLTPQTPLRAGICERCAHQQLVANTRGSTFSLCRRSRTDPAFVRYPRLPVLACEGFVPRERQAVTDTPGAPG